MELIEGGGRFASVADVEPAAVVLNPLLPVDYHNDYGVGPVPTTEDVRNAVFLAVAGGWSEGLGGETAVCVQEGPHPASHALWTPLTARHAHCDLHTHHHQTGAQFIRESGRMLEGRDALRLDAEVELGEADFVDPGVAFRDAGECVFVAGLK